MDIKPKTNENKGHWSDQFSMYDEQEDYIIDNPLIMQAPDFIAWLLSRDVALAGKPPNCPIKRASLLFELALSGKIDGDEMKEYFKEIGLMVPIEEN